MEFSKFDIPDELFEEIVFEILGYEANNLKMLRITREILGNRKIGKLFTRLDKEKELEKLINKDLEKYLDFELEPQTEMSFEEKYRPFLNAIEEIQTKVLEIKTGR